MTEVAYNLENFMAKTAEQQDKELKKSSLRMIENRRKAKVVAPVKVILASAVALVISVIMIYSQVVLTELTSEVSFYENQIVDLDTEYVRLQSELESITSIKTLEEAAETKLGLTKIDSSQVEYVNLTGGDEITVAHVSGKYLIKENWENFVNSISEYLKF